MLAMLSTQQQYFDFHHDVPINQHPDYTCRDFHMEHCQCGNCELRLLGWNTVYMLAFHTENILKAALTTSNGLAD